MNEGIDDLERVEVTDTAVLAEDDLDPLPIAVEHSAFLSIDIACSDSGEGCALVGSSLDLFVLCFSSVLDDQDSARTRGWMRGWHLHVFDLKIVSHVAC